MNDHHPAVPAPLSQHQRELALAGLLDITLEQFGSWLALQDEASLAAMPDGAGEHVAGYFEAMREAEALAGQPDAALPAQLMFQRVALMCDVLLLWTVREISGKDPLS